MFSVATFKKTDEETQTPEPTKRPPIPKVALIAGSALLVIIVVIVALVLSLNKDVPLSPTVAPQISLRTGFPEPHIGVEPVPVGILANTRLYPLVQLAKAHPLISIGLLVGVILIAVAITLGVVLSRPSEPVIGQPDVKDVTKDEQELGQGGEESVWKQYMGLWIVLIVLGSIALAAVIFLIIRNVFFKTTVDVTGPNPLVIDPTSSLTADQKKLVADMKSDIQSARDFFVLIPQSHQLHPYPTTNLNDGTKKEVLLPFPVYDSLEEINGFRNVTESDNSVILAYKSTATGENKVYVKYDEKFVSDEWYNFEYLDLDGYLGRLNDLHWDALKHLNFSYDPKFPKRETPSHT